MPKVSVIIPFNNVENYIEECLNSVLSQTLDDMEIILINDASTDRTLEIVDGYLQKDSRIKLINIEEQKGQGFARNRGIEIAQGEYIGFVDSDDFIEPDMFECLYNSAKTNNTDISMCQVREYDDINENYITSDYYSLNCLSDFQNNVFSAEDTKNYILDINVALWNKIYKREYLKNIGEQFPEGYIYEDLPFFFGTYIPAKRIQIVWKNLYSYRINRKNSTMQQFNNKILDRIPMVSLTYEKLKKIPYLSDLKQKIQAWIINDLFHRYSLLKENYHKEFFFQMKKVFQSLEIENIEDEYWKRVYYFQGYLLVINNSFEDFNNKVFMEYLDIHKVEDRLRSEIIGIDEIDKRFSSVYQEITKNYKYTEELFSEAKDINGNLDGKIENIYNDIEQNKNDLYLNIENSKTDIVKETDSKISQVYEEITKNYKYTEELFSEAKDKNAEFSYEIEKVFKNLESNKNELYTNLENSKQGLIKETDYKISQVYEEITKNYKYTEELFSKLNEENSVIYNKIEENKLNLLQDTDLKVSQIYDEITKNYKYTDELVQGNLDKLDSKINSDLENKYNHINERLEEKSKYLYNDIKDLSFVLQNNFIELNKEQDRISEQNKQIFSDIDYYKKETEEKNIQLRKEYKEFVATKIQSISNNFEQLDLEVKKHIEILRSRLEEERQENIQNIEELKSQFYYEFRNQEKIYQEEIERIRKQMQEMEIKLREEMKSPIKRLIEKYKVKLEK